MTRYERVLNALRHKETDIIPYQMEFSSDARLIMSEYLNNSEFELQWNAQHISSCIYTGRPQQIADKEGFYQDEYGVIWDRTGRDKELGIILENPISDITKNAYSFKPLNRDALLADYQHLFHTLGDRFPIAGLGLAVYERAWTLLGVENLNISMVNHPNEVTELFEGITENALEIVEVAGRAGFKAFFVGDDWAEDNQLLLPIENWRTFVLPVLKKIYERVHHFNMYTIQHCCGNISGLLPDLVNIGLDCYQTVQPELYNVGELKSDFGNDLAFWGGISTKKYLPKYTIERAKEHVVETMRLFGRGGGYIAAPSHALTSDIRPEVILGILDVFQNQNKYL